MVRRSLLVLVLILTACGQVSGNGVLQEGKKAPSVKTKTLADVHGDMSRITSYHFPVPEMYKYSLATALTLGKPIVMEFATPAHCTQCDKQLMLLKVMLKKYGDRVIFLHMDEYYNPGAYHAFGVRGEPWTIFIDTHGIVRHVYPGRVIMQELAPMIAGLFKFKAPIKPVGDAAHIAPAAKG